MKRNWWQLVPQSELGKSSTVSLQSRTVLLEKHIVVIQGKLVEVSSMVQDLGVLLVELSNSIKKKRSLEI